MNKKRRRVEVRANVVVFGPEFNLKSPDPNIVTLHTGHGSYGYIAYLSRFLWFL